MTRPYRRRAAKPVVCKRCHRSFDRNSEVGRHVRDGGYCVECDARTTSGVRCFRELPPKPFGLPPADNHLELEDEDLERLGEIIAEDYTGEKPASLSARAQKRRQEEG